MHYDKLWYYWIDEYDCKKYWRKLEEDDIKLLTEDIITERKCKEQLQILFPEYKIMKAIPYHYSPRFGNGSRPIKSTVARKIMLKEKMCFKRNLEKFIK